MNEREVGTGGRTLGECIIGEDASQEWLLDSFMKARKLRERVEAMLDRLTPREREVLEARFGRKLK